MLILNGFDQNSNWRTKKSLHSRDRDRDKYRLLQDVMRVDICMRKEIYVRPWHCGIWWKLSLHWIEAVAFHARLILFSCLFFSYIISTAHWWSMSVYLIAFFFPKKGRYEYLNAGREKRMTVQINAPVRGTVLAVGTGLVSMGWTMTFITTR
jgi:hypothetical protein